MVNEMRSKGLLTPRPCWMDTLSQRATHPPPSAKAFPRPRPHPPRPPPPGKPASAKDPATLAEEEGPWPKAPADLNNQRKETTLMQQLENDADECDIDDDTDNGVSIRMRTIKTNAKLARI